MSEVAPPEPKRAKTAPADGERCGGRDDTSVGALEEELFAAATAGDLSAVESALARGARPWAQLDACGSSALMRAAAGGYETVVAAMLEVRRSGRLARGHDRGESG